MIARLFVFLPFIALFICDLAIGPWREVTHKYLFVGALIWGSCILFATAVRFTLTMYFSKKAFNKLFSKGEKTHGKE